MKRLTRLSICITAGALAFAVAPRADAPHIYAIRGARLVTASGAPIATGTIVLRNGLIDAVGADVQSPPDATVIDGAGMTVYPGLIDMGNAAGLDAAPPTPPATFRTTEDAERWKRSVILRPELEAAEVVRPDAPELSRLAASGVTTVLATPTAGSSRARARSSTSPRRSTSRRSGPWPIRGAACRSSGRRSRCTSRSRLGRVAAAAADIRCRSSASIAFVRQSFLDAQHQQLEKQRYEKTKTGVARPLYDPSLDAMQPALARTLPVAFEAGSGARDPPRADMAKEFNLDPVITGAREADQVVADLKAQNARVIYGLDFPARSRALPPDADEPLRELRARAQASKTPGALEKRRRARSRSRRAAFSSRGTSSGTPHAR